MKTPVDQAPTPTAEQRRSATQLAERARQAVNALNLDYAIELLQTCCHLDPANLIYRKSLRQAVRLKYRQRSPHSWMGGLQRLWRRWRMRTALQAKRYQAVLDKGEALLAVAPGDVPTSLIMSEAAIQWGLPEVAIFILEQLRIDHPRHAQVHRSLARLYEQQGQYRQAIRTWQQVARIDPTDATAARKVKDLAAVSTIQNGQYDEKTIGDDGVVGRRPTAADGAASKPKSSVQKHMEALRQQMVAEPKQPRAYVQLAQLFQQNNQWDDARNVLERGLADTNQHYEIRLAMEALEIAFFRSDLQVCQAKQQQDPSLPEIRQQVVRLQKEILAREVAYYRHQADLMPKNMELRFELGVRLWQSQLVDEALAELQLAAKDPEWLERCQSYLGHCYRARRNWPLAKKHYEQALAAATVMDDMKKLLYCLAQGAADYSDWKAAVQYGAELVELDPDYEDIRSVLPIWQQRVSDPSVML